MIDYKIPCLLFTIISPVILYELGPRVDPLLRPPPPPTQNRRNFVPDGLAPFYSSYAHPYRYESPNGALPQYNRPVRAAPKGDMMPSSSNQMPRRQRAPMPKYSKFTLDDASAGYLNLPHGFQSPIKPTGFVPGNLFSAYKYTPAVNHLPLNSLGGYYGTGASYGVESNANRGPSIFPDSQTEKPIEEPMQEVPITPTPVSELTKAAVLHQHMFTSPSTEKPKEVVIPSVQPGQDVQYEIKYVPVYVDEDGKEVKSEELSNYRLKYESMDTAEPAKYAAPTQAYVSVPSKANVAYKYASLPSATSYKYESQKFLPSGYESSVSTLVSRETHDKDYKDYPSYAPKYEFGYRVHDSYTGSDFGQSEHRDGEVTKGSYHVLLPDGRHQTVNYWSDDSGFHAKVKYDGIAKHYPAPAKSHEVKGYEHSVDSNSIHS